MADKTFTQEEVNTIIQDRLAKEKAKYEKQLADVQTDIQQREKRLEAREKLQEKGLPLELVDLIKLDSDESFNTSLSLLEKTYKTRVSEEQAFQGKSGYEPAAGGKPSPDIEIRHAMGLGL